MSAIRGVMFGLLLAFIFPLRADDPVNLAGEPPPVQIDLTLAHGQLDVEYLLVPEDKLDAFRDSFDQMALMSALGDILKKSGGKVVASASTSLALGGDGTMLELADSRLTLRPRIISVNQFHLDGRLTRATFGGTFDVLLQPGHYQLFLLWNQPPHAGVKDPYNVVVARMREISVESPSGEVRVLTEGPGSTSPVPTPRASQPPPEPQPKIGKVLYENRGDNTKGFDPKFGSPNFTVCENTLVANAPGHNGRDDDTGWFSLPLSLAGNFRIDFDVRPDANDGSSWITLYDDATNKGIIISNCQQTSFGNHSINIYEVLDLTDHDKIFVTPAMLATAVATHFANQEWTHVTITKHGHTITDTVGGQTISTELPEGALSAKAHLGLGYYATKNVGGNGQMSYANIRVVQQ